MKKRGTFCIRTSEEGERRGRESGERERKKEKVSIFTVAIYIFAADEQSLEADDFRKRASSTREIMFLSRASLPRLQVRSQSKRQRTGSGASFRCSKLRESLSSVSPSLFNHSLEYQRPSRRPLRLVRAAASSSSKQDDLPSTKSGLSKLPKVC